ncbi:MAG TPA: D-alanine--D-alanine ligase [candidate division Zixibacteria bacterium]|nr:D-alanine--D-alanine ligase [candidate division Zixibacteria bacterium]
MDNKSTVEKKIKIAVLMGGNSAERDVSLASGAGIVAGLKAAGHEAIGIDTALGAGQLSAQTKAEIAGIKAEPPSVTDLSVLSSETTIETVSSPDLKQVDLVFIALHGGMGENGTIQALLDLMDIPYTGSGVLASAAAMDKLIAKKIFIASDIPTPDYFVKLSTDICDEIELISEVKNGVGFPVVVKPNDQGSSVGLDIARDAASLFEIAKKAALYSDKVLFEKFIPGRELTVAILDDQTLPVVEIKPHDGFYDYRHKYTVGKTDYLVPAPITEDEERRTRELGLLAFEALGCRGYARVDFRMSPEGKLFCLEVNTLPGMTATSLVPKAARAAGIEFSELLSRIAESALHHHKKGNRD